MTKAGTGIKTYSDLAGKTICVGDAKWSFVPHMVSGLKAMGVWDKAKNKYMGAAELPDALKAGIVDAVISAIAGLAKRIIRTQATCEIDRAVGNTGSSLLIALLLLSSAIQYGSC